MSTTIPLRKLGTNGPSVTALGFGLMGLSSMYGELPDDEERFKVLDRAADLGYTFWDTSDLYGDSEKLLGKWFKRTGRRNEIFLASKFGFVKNTNYEIDSSGAFAKKACEESLRDLGVDCIDLYYVHRANPKTPIEDTMRALVELKNEGKIKHIGLSEVSSATLRKAHKIHPVAAVQTEYSAFVLDVEGSAGSDILATCRELGVALVAYSPLGRGLLTSAFSNDELTHDGGDMRSNLMPRFMDANRAANIELVRRFTALADKKGCTTSQLALAWLLKQGPDVIPIPGTKKIKYLESNWDARTVVLSDAEQAEIRAFVENAEVAGARNPPGFSHLSYVDTADE